MKSTSQIKILAEGKYLRLVKQGAWEYAERKGSSGAVVIVAVTDAGKLLLTEQFRIPVGKPVLELPAGLVGDSHAGPDEDWALAAERELLEETGYQAKRMTYLAEGPVSAGFGSEAISFYRATGLTKVGAGGGVDGEAIRVHEVRVDRVRAWLRKKQREGILIDLKIFAGLFFAGG